jgi:hypothetical protein
MPKRTFWLMTGTALGVGSTLWAERKVRRTVQQASAKLQPDALVVEVGRSARHVAESAGERVRGAMSSGRDEMLRHEEELWADLAARGVETGARPVPYAGGDDRLALGAGPVVPAAASHTPSTDHRSRGRRRRGVGRLMAPLTPAAARQRGDRGPAR